MRRSRPVSAARPTTTTSRMAPIHARAQICHWQRGLASTVGRLGSPPCQRAGSWPLPRCQSGLCPTAATTRIHQLASPADAARRQPCPRLRRTSFSVSCHKIPKVATEAAPTGSHIATAHRRTDRGAWRGCGAYGAADVSDLSNSDEPAPCPMRHVCTMPIPMERQGAICGQSGRA